MARTGSKPGAPGLLLIQVAVVAAFVGFARVAVPDLALWPGAAIAVAAWGIGGLIRRQACGSAPRKTGEHA